MVLHRFVVGILFNKRMFRLPSLGGALVDEILNFCDNNKTLGTEFFTKVATPITKDNEYNLQLMDDDDRNLLIIRPDQFIFKKKSLSSKSSLNIEKTIEEFKVLWRKSNSIINYPETRRIGMVGEYRIEENQKDNAGIELISKLTKFENKKSCHNFRLNFEERSLTNSGVTPNIETDDFWNEIYNIYTSNIDETPEDGYINTNLDIQKYYNPAKKDPLRELNSILDRYRTKKIDLIKKLDSLGLNCK